MASHPSANTITHNLESGARIALIGMLVNVILATVKIVAGVLGHSYVLIADGIESALDIGGSAAVSYMLLFIVTFFCVAFVNMVRAGPPAAAAGKQR